MRIARADLGTITRIGVGGQGVVYAAPSLRMQYTSSLVYKEYKADALVSLDFRALEAMPTYLETLPFAEGMELLALTAWPCRLVDDSSGAVQGFVMPTIPDRFFAELTMASGRKRVPGEVQHLLNSESFLARRQIPLTDRHRFELLAETAKGLAVLHRHDIAVGDLSPKNLLYSFAPDVGVYFIDADAMRLRGRAAVPQLETPEWEVRAVNPGEELGTPAADSYKLALLALRSLAGDQSTRDPNRLPSSVGRDAGNLITAGLDHSPSARPSPVDWGGVLVAAAAAAATKPPRLPVTPRTTSSPRPTPRSAGTTNRRTAARPVPAPRPTPTAYVPARSWWERRTTGGKAAVVIGVVVALLLGRSLLTSSGSDGVDVASDPGASAATGNTTSDTVPASDGGGAGGTTR